MNNLGRKAIADIFRGFADKIENNTCFVDTETLTQIANTMVHIKLNPDQMCEYLNTSRATLTRMIADGRVPIPHKDKGGGKYWYQDEVDNHISEYKRRYGID